LVRIEFRSLSNNPLSFLSAVEQRLSLRVQSVPSPYL
jgi:hypothetical protein